MRSVSAALRKDNFLISIILLVGFAAIVIAAFAPHNDDTNPDGDCLLCKVREQPLHKQTLRLLINPSNSCINLAKSHSITTALRDVTAKCSPRAPPA